MIASGESATVDFTELNISGGTLGAYGFEKSGAGSLVIDSANSFTVDNFRVNAGTLTISENATIITDQAAVTNVAIASGATVYNNGTIMNAGNVTVPTGATYGGRGTVTGFFRMTGGTFEPGRANQEINDTNIGGNFVVVSGATNLFNIDSDGIATDLINVGGNFSIGAGASAAVFVRGQGARAFVVGQQYKFIESTSILAGTAGRFSGVTTDVNGTITLVVDATSVYFVFTSLDGGTSGFASIAENPNQLSIGRYLDLVTPTATGDFATVTAQLATLNADQQRAAMDQMGGQAEGTQGQAAINTTTLMTQQVVNHLSGLSIGGSAGAGPSTNLMAQVSPNASPAASPNNIQQVSYSPDAVKADTVEEKSACLVCGGCANEKLWNGWSVGYGLGGSAGARGGVAGASYGVGGFIAGVDRWIDDSTLVGVFGGYLGSGFTTGTPSASVHDNAGQGGIYAQRRGDVFYASALFGGQSDQFTSRRNINFGTINRTATGNYDGWQGFGYSELGANLTASNLTLQPYGAMQYIHLRQNSISETGAGSLNLATAGMDTDSLRSFLGTRLRYDNHGENNFRRFIPELQASWLHEYIDASTALTARFGAVGGNGFITNGLNVGRDWALLGAGFTYVVTDNIRLTANYYAQTNDRQTYHVGAGGLSVQW